MAGTKRTALVTGCSDGGLGAALAIALHEAGLHVYATARNPAKMTEVKAKSIETLTLDVMSDDSIAACVKQVPSLDILINNAGGGYNMPVADLDITEAKKLFDLNVWSLLAVTQAFLPHLLKSRGMIVNHTSSASVCTIPFGSTYNASKAAMAAYSDTQRLELAPFGIKVVDLKTGGVKSNFYDSMNTKEGYSSTLPKGSIYEPAGEIIEAVMHDGLVGATYQPASQWAKEVTRDLLRKNPPSVVWRGAKASLVWLSTFLPYGAFDGTIKKMTRLDEVEKKIQS
jgi:1-acylglycerone phosphate reductase